LTAYRCPTCGAEGRFASGAPYAVCRYCRSLLVRNDVTVESIGQVAAVPDDLSPLQLGVTGLFERQRFTVVGRLRKTWEDGSWNEWCVLFEDQRFGWLAEAQGDWVMTFEQPAAALAEVPTAIAAARAQPGERWRIGGRAFEVRDSKQVRCAAAEGELSVAFSIGEQALSIDLAGAGLEFATVEFRAGVTSGYVGRFVEFTECHFANLRHLDGWGG